MAESLASGDASVMVPIAQKGFTVTAVLGFVLLGEPFTARKGAGLAAALAALASFAYGAAETGAHDRVRKNVARTDAVEIQSPPMIHLRR